MLTCIARTTYRGWVGGRVQRGGMGGASHAQVVDSEKTAYKYHATV